MQQSTLNTEGRISLRILSCYRLDSTATLHSTLALKGEPGPVCVVFVRVCVFMFVCVCVCVCVFHAVLTRETQHHLTRAQGERSAGSRTKIRSSIKTNPSQAYRRCAMQDRHQEQADTWKRYHQTQHTRLGAILAEEPPPVSAQRLESKWSRSIARCRHQ